LHKFSAKNLIFGKKVTFLPHCHSTNQYMRQLVKQGGIGEGHLVLTDYQSQGRGQMGTTWESDPGDNLLFSVLTKPVFLGLKHQFYITLISALGIIEGLEHMQIKHLSVKWPNDVYLGEEKLAGILSEAIIAGSFMEYLILGVGLNVNQASFSVNRSTSLARYLGVSQQREEVLQSVLTGIEKWYLALKREDYQLIRNSYEKRMLGIHQKRLFEDQSGRHFQAMIKGIDPQGKLIMNIGGEHKLFNHKEIQYRWDTP
jgi:BirA family biotin operon repressor/biotin-[acetyl-CoA-carboxylase] ligase